MSPQSPEDETEGAALDELEPRKPEPAARLSGPAPPRQEPSESSDRLLAEETDHAASKDAIDRLPSTGLLSFYDRLRRRVERTLERRGGRLGHRACSFGVHCRQEHRGLHLGTRHRQVIVDWPQADSTGNLQRRRSIAVAFDRGAHLRKRRDNATHWAPR